MRVHEYLAQAFVAEGVEAVFGLMGDGNMAWMASMAAQPGVRVIHARYEGAALAMADGYARASHRVGVASVTCGPGVTQIVTSLTAAVRRGGAMVVFTGDTPASATYHLQELDQRPIIRATGAGYLRAESAAQVADVVARAFHQARSRCLPVVLSVPYDLQEQVMPEPDSAVTSQQLVVDTRPLRVDPRDLDDVVGLLVAASRPIILAGAGAVSADCRDDVLQIASRFGAHTATTLRAKGWFDGEPGDLGVAGGFACDAARVVFGEADLVLALGAKLSHHTTDGGTMWPKATVVQVDLAPVGYVDGLRVADRYVQADVREVARALLRSEGPQPARAPVEPIPAGQEHPAGPPTTSVDGVQVFDPRHVMWSIDDAIPRDSPIVVGVGHFWNFVVPALTGRAPSRYHFTYDFGVIGQALPTGIGVAVAEGNSGTVVIEGDGSLLMNVQELETLARHDVPVLVIVLNDGAYGAEYHKLPLSGSSADLAVFGWTPLDRVAEAFGLRARRPATLEDITAAIDEYVADPAPTLMDVRTDYRAVSPQFSRRFTLAPRASTI